MRSLPCGYIIFSPEECVCYSLGELRFERRDALSASMLSRGTANLVGPGRTPAFHWARPSRLRAVSLVMGRSLPQGARWG